MIKIEKTETYGWDAAIRGLRNPKNSWDRSDSCPKSIWKLGDDVIEDFIGPNDLKLMKTLANAGNDHGKYLRYITVTMDVTAPLYWWKEADTYKVGTVADSCSTMHKIHEKEFELNDFSHEHLTDKSTECLLATIDMLNKYRWYFNSNREKGDWWQMIQLLPSSYNQKRTMLVNYMVLKNMYHARKNHKLDEWHVFCDWIKSLPYSELITGEEA